MARGSIKKRILEDGGVRYDAIVDLGVDPVTNRRRQRKRTFTAKKDATATLTAWQAEIDGGTAVERSRQTVKEVLELWLDTYARHHTQPTTFEGYERTIRAYLIPGLGALSVQKLTAEHIQVFYSARLTEGRGARTVQLCHLRLKQALSMAVKMGLVARNVADQATPPRVTAKEMETWDASQARTFLAVAAHSSYGPLWIVALATGMRRGELLGLRWADVDLERGMVSIRQTVGLVAGAPVVKTPKSKASRRTIPVQQEVIAALREHKARQNARRLALGAIWEDHDLVFTTGAGKPVNPNNLAADYNRLVAAAGVPRIRVHDLRHTHVTLALQSGAHLKAVSERVGHAKTSITMDVYAHVSRQQHEEVADKIGAALFGTGAG